MHIDSYDFGRIVIDGVSYSSDVIIYPDRIALDLGYGKMYLLDDGHSINHPGKIFRADLDGSDLEEVISLPYGPCGIAIEPDCNGNSSPDHVDIATGTSDDCNGNTFPDECEPDCNANGTADRCDIAGGTSADCNENHIPDECESPVDCNANGIWDVCEVLAGTGSDCNANGIPDECDISAGTSEDCTGNGIPDECEPDCNGNGIADSCDMDLGTSDDCNDNNVPDECESDEDCNGNLIQDICDLSDGTSTDCNDDGIPDDCQLDDAFVSTSPQLSHVDYGPRSYAVPATRPAAGDVTLAFSAYADLGYPAEWIGVDLNGVAVGRVFVESANDCPGTPDVDGLVVASETFNAVLASAEDVVVTMTQSASVQENCDPVDYITVELRYSMIADCNGNDVFDTCEITNGTSDDCNANGVPDECEPDCNANGVADSCDIGGLSEDCTGKQTNHRGNEAV